MAVARKGVVVLMLAFALLAMAQTGESWALEDCYNQCLDTCARVGRSPYACKFMVCTLGCAFSPEKHVDEAKIMELIKKAPPAPASKAPTTSPSEA